MKFITNKQNSHKGFTLIELLVVVAIIGVLATVVLSSLSAARSRSRDAKRIATMRSLESALELYYLDNNQYPRMLDANGLYSSALWTYGHNDRWLSLSTILSPYITFDPLDMISDTTSGAWFYYHAGSGPSGTPQHYGLYVKLENSNPITASDGGYSDGVYETGPSVSYCLEKYTGTAADWKSCYSGGNCNNICTGGN